MVATFDHAFTTVVVAGAELTCIAILSETRLVAGDRTGTVHLWDLDADVTERLIGHTVNHALLYTDIGHTVNHALLHRAG